MVYRVGSLKNTNTKLYTKKEKLNWSDDDIDLLGVKIPNVAKTVGNSTRNH